MYFIHTNPVLQSNEICLYVRLYIKHLHRHVCMGDKLFQLKKKTLDKRYSLRSKILYFLVLNFRAEFLSNFFENSHSCFIFTLMSQWCDVPHDTLCGSSLKRSTNLEQHEYTFESIYIYGSTTAKSVWAFFSVSHKHFRSNCEALTAKSIRDGFNVSERGDGTVPAVHSARSRIYINLWIGRTWNGSISWCKKW